MQVLLFDFEHVLFVLSLKPSKLSIWEALNKHWWNFRIMFCHFRPLRLVYF